MRQLDDHFTRDRSSSTQCSTTVMGTDPPAAMVGFFTGEP